MSRFACALIALSLLVPKQSVAQNVEYDLAELRARIDSLSALQQQLRQAASVRDSVAAATRTEKSSVPLDTAVVGPFTLITSARDREHVERLFARAWSDAPGTIKAAEQRLRGSTWVVALKSDTGALQTFAKQEKLQFLPIIYWRVDSFAEDPVERVLLEATVQTFPREVRQWLGRVSRPTDPQKLRRELAVAPGEKAQRCHAGEVEACIDVLGLRGERWAVWYTPDEIREYVRRFAPNLQEDFEGACSEPPDTEVCVRFVETRLRLAPPVGSRIRASFLWHVLDRASPSDLDRFASDTTATLEQRMRNVAGDLEAAVRSWHAEVIEAPQQSMPATARAGIASVIWFVVAAGFATRSTRWRLG